MELSKKPYILRAMYDWVLDQGDTPYVTVDYVKESAKVPKECINNGIIILNVSPYSTKDLKITNDWVSFKAKFKGIEREVIFRSVDVKTIYGKETGIGFMFPALAEKYKPNLRLVR